MKRLFLLWAAHKLDKLKLDSTGVYLFLITVLTWVHDQLTDPEVLAMIQELIGTDSPWVAKIIKGIVFLTGGLIGVRTSQKAVQYATKRSLRRQEERAKKANQNVDRYTKF